MYGAGDAELDPAWWRGQTPQPVAVPHWQVQERARAWGGTGEAEASTGPGFPGARGRQGERASATCSPLHTRELHCAHSAAVPNLGSGAQLSPITFFYPFLYQVTHSKNFHAAHHTGSTASEHLPRPQLLLPQQAAQKGQVSPSDGKVNGKTRAQELPWDGQG